jgi:hypothetical protein
LFIASPSLSMVHNSICRSLCVLVNNFIPRLPPNTVLTWTWINIWGIFVLLGLVRSPVDCGFFSLICFILHLLCYTVTRYSSILIWLVTQV